MFFFLSMILGVVQVESISHQEVCSLPKQLEMHWEREGGDFSFDMSSDGGSFSLSLSPKEWEGLPERAKEKFSKSINGYTFTYLKHSSALKSESLNCLAKRRIFKNSKPSSLSMEELARFVKSKNVIFYTGAGISAAAGVPTMQKLDSMFPFNQRWIEKAVLHPNSVMRDVRYFHRACFCSKPTLAHLAIQKISLKKSIPVFTENWDHLHQKSGVKPVCVTAETVKAQVAEEKLKQVDAIICVGLSFDDKGLLGWYKSVHPKGKLISIDLAKPSYLGDEDYLFKGDLQKVLPNLLKRIGS